MGVDLSVLAAFGLGPPDRAAWLVSGLPTEAFEDWLVDRVARRPSGERARAVYGADDVHEFARRAILGSLRLRPGDRLLDIGCGGGVLLRDAIAAGVAGAGLDHSEDMVLLAHERAPAAAVLRGRAESLPFREGAFTAVSMSIVLIFLPDPLWALREVRRVLAPGGRIAVYTTSAELRGTPAAPEPLASHAYFQTDAGLVDLGRRAGFADVSVDNDDGGQLLTGHRGS